MVTSSLVTSTAKSRKNANAFLVSFCMASCGYFAISSGGWDTATSAVHRSLRYVSSDYVLPGFEDKQAFTRIKNGRKFLGYTSSAWEEEWLAHMDEWQKEQTICDHILDDDGWAKMRRFLEATCTRYPHPSTDHPHRGSPWCAMDDAYNSGGGLFYNRETGMLTVGRQALPEDLQFEDEVRPLSPSADYEDIFSKFTYRDEVTGNTYAEYIEPLVSHLRHPLSQCMNHPMFRKRVLAGGREKAKIDGWMTGEQWDLIVARGYLIPPPPRVRSSDHNGNNDATTPGKTYYFDAGASSWSQGPGGPSLSVLSNYWNRNGMAFDDIRAFEGSTSPEAFYAVVPEEWKDRTTFTQAWIRSLPDLPATDDAELDGPFLPTHITETVSPNDYVIFKLDIDSPTVETNTVLYLLSEEGAADLANIDEFFWEHHVFGNYLMQGIWGMQPGEDDRSIRESAELFLQLRQKGVRSHSWV